MQVAAGLSALIKATGYSVHSYGKITWLKEVDSEEGAINIRRNL